MQMQPMLVNNPLNIKIIQGDEYEYALPEIAEPSDGVAILV